MQPLEIVVTFHSLYLPHSLTDGDAALSLHTHLPNMCSLIAKLLDISMENRKNKSCISQLKLIIYSEFRTFSQASHLSIF